MMHVRSHWSIASLCCLLVSSAAQAQTNPALVNPDGIPVQIVPTFKEVGIIWGGPSNGSSSGGGGTPFTDPGGNQSGPSSALNALNATSYGATAIAAAQQEGVNAESVAAIGQVESGFRNISTANGSSSATGPWQFTTPTFLSVSQQHGLGYTAADVTNPQDQAIASAYLMRDYAKTVSQAIGQPATTLQTYGAWVFGTQSGSNIATAAPSTPLNQLVSAQSLSNNGMSSWTVGQFQQVMGNRLGSAANQPVLTSS